jgi:hypothetical protein
MMGFVSSLNAAHSGGVFLNLQHIIYLLAPVSILIP